MNRYIWHACVLILYFLLTPLIYASTVPCSKNCPTTPAGTTTADWPMLAGNLERTNWNTEEVRGVVYPEWYTVINAQIARESQIIAANNALFISTDKGLVAMNAATGTALWTFGTHMPLGSAPTYANGIVYAGGYDRRIYAINTSDGKLKTGWTFVEAGAGFETNPIVVNNRVYAGNRDGYMYCLDAATGALIWKWRDETDEWPDAPIRYSAAYKNGVIYWGQDNAHAYALKDNGSTPALVFKSAQLPGVGFSTYWTILYHDPTSNKDYIVLSGTKKDNSFVWWNTPDQDYYYYRENYDIHGSVPFGTYVGARGNVAGEWVSGTATIDVSKIQNYFNAKPHKRHVMILDSANGSEFKPYAPYNWMATHGGTQYPPLISGIDGVMYHYIGYQYGPDANTYPNMGASGCIAGWKFGTQYISEVCHWPRGYADEPVQYTAGGNLIYWVEGFNMPYGAFEINKPLGTNASWEYAPCAGDCLGIPNHGGDGPLTPYKNRLYMLDGNAIIAFGSSNTKTEKPSITIGNPTTTQSTQTPSSTIRQKLEQELQKMMSAGVLRPGYHDSGIWGSYVNGAYSPFGEIPYTTGDHIAEYFHTPGDTVTTLVWAYPYVSSTIQTQIKNYLSAYYGPGKSNDISTIAHIGWKNGAQREIYLDTPEIIDVAKRNWEDMNLTIAAAPRTTSQYPDGYITKIWNFPQDSFYGAWKYAQLFPDQAGTLFNAIKGKLESPNLANPDLTHLPYILNQWINGYIGYVELGKLAGVNVSTQQNTLNSLIDVRMNNFASTFTHGSYEGVLRRSKNFMFMTPELAGYFRSRINTSSVQALDSYTSSSPYWFVSKFENVSGEGVYQTLYEYEALFQAKAWIKNDSYANLVSFIDTPAFWRGDLYYIQNLIALLEKAGTVPSPTPAPPSPTAPAGKAGDANGDGIVDGRDYIIWAGNYNKPITGVSNGDFDGNGLVDGRDYIVWMNNYGK